MLFRSKLELLHILGNHITNLEPLSNLTNLRTLNMLNNNIYDISVLANLTLLQLIEISSNNITDISPIAGLQNLNEVYLAWNCITDFSSIQHLIDDGTINDDGHNRQRDDCAGDTNELLGIDWTITDGGME